MFYLCKDIAVRRPLRSTSRVWADVKCEVEVQYLWGFWEGGFSRAPFRWVTR